MIATPFSILCTNASCRNKPALLHHPAKRIAIGLPLGAHRADTHPIAPATFQSCKDMLHQSAHLMRPYRVRRWQRMGNTLVKVATGTWQMRTSSPPALAPSIRKKITKPKSCTYIRNRLVSLNKQSNAKRHFSSYCRPDQASYNRLNCITGNDTKRHCGTL